MEDIIRSIIDIDRDAEQKLEDAEKEKLRIINEAKLRSEQIVSAAVEEAKSRLAAIEEEKKQSTDERLAELEEQKNRSIEELKNSFKKNADVWCDEIFAAVINR